MSDSESSLHIRVLAVDNEGSWMEDQSVVYIDSNFDAVSNLEIFSNYGNG